MAGENATLSAKDYGSIRVKLLTIGFGFSIVADEDSSRNKRAFYPRAESDDAMSMVLVFKTYGEFTAAATWFVNYGEKTKEGWVEPIRVLVPSRGFDRTGRYTSGCVIGDDVTYAARYLALNFAGCMDASVTNSWGNGAMAQVQGSADPTSVYFYPSGTQLVAGDAETSIFATPSPPVEIAPTPVGSSGGKRVA